MSYGRFGNNQNEVFIFIDTENFLLLFIAPSTKIMALTVNRQDHMTER